MIVIITPVFNQSHARNLVAMQWLFPASRGLLECFKRVAFPSPHLNMTMVSHLHLSNEHILLIFERLSDLDDIVHLEQSCWNLHSLLEYGQNQLKVFRSAIVWLIYPKSFLLLTNFRFMLDITNITSSYATC